ncbi:MAG: Gfo/Idh/MocA family oxidoreductase [Planctomycetota bacterium]
MAKLKIGIIGLGFMGKMHFDTYGTMPNAKVVAFADVDEKKRAGDWTGIVGNIAGKGQGPDLRGVTVYERAEDLIRDPRVEAVDITLPTYLHAKYALKALAAKKPTLCEKPMARTSAEAARMAEAARTARVPLCIGHCIRFWPEYAKAREIVEGGRFGAALHATFTRLSLTPDWSWQNWLQDPKKSGGAPLDLHIHDADFVQYLFGRPAFVSARSAGFQAGAPVDHIVATYAFRGRKNLLVTAEGGWMYAPGFGFTMQFRIHLEKATLTFGMGADPGLTIHTKTGRTLKPTVARGDGYTQELAYFVRSIQKREAPKIVTPASSVASVRLVEAEMQSARAGGRPVAVK